MQTKFKPKNPDEIEMNKTSSDLICPFCEETDFDLIGLKNHIQNYCRVFREIDILD